MDETWVRTRLDALHRELASGDQLLAELSEREAGVREDMLRIAGAAAVLEELLANADVDRPATNH
jgi:hypothetical protein